MPPSGTPRVQLPVGDRPGDAGRVFDEGGDRIEAFEPGGEHLRLAVLHACDRGRIRQASPEPTGPRDGERLHRARNRRVAEVVPREEAPAIETHQSRVRAEPEVAVVGLDDRDTEPSGRPAPSCHEVRE